MKDILSELFSLPLEDPVLIFSVILAIILFAPIIFDKIKIPHIVGMILAGMILGPNGINLLSHDSSFELFGQVGILYIMFIAGIDMDMNDFKQNRKKSIVFGVFTFLIPMILGSITGFYLIKEIILTASGEASEITWLQGNPSNNVTLIKYCTLSAVVLASMYASNTLIAYPIISRFGIAKQRSVNITVGGTMITTILSLLVLAIILEVVRQGTIDYIFWIRLIVSLGIYSVILFYLYPLIGRWFFKRFDDNIAQYIFVLSMVFLSSFLAKVAGVEYIIGAFLAGVTLNRLVPRQSPLMNRIDFVGNAIFIPFFLINVGMIVNFNVIFQGYLTILTAVVMSVVATFSKYLAAKITQKIYKMDPEEGSMIFGLSNAQAAATLAAVTIAYNLIIGNNADGTPIRLLSEEILNGTIIMILVTCTISSIVTEKSARKLALSSETDASENTYNPENRILIPVSNPETLDSLIELALLIKDKKDKQPVYALKVVDDNQNSDKISQGKKLLDRAATIGAGADIKVKRISRYDLNISSGICNVVKEKNISDVVLGLHSKSSATDSFFGNMTDSLLGGINRMIYIYKSIQPMATIKRVVVATPPKCEFESGFNRWCNRVFTLSSQTGGDVVFYCTKETKEAIISIAKETKTSVNIAYNLLADWEDFLILTKEVQYNDLLMVVTARKQSISYTPLLEKLPKQLSNYFSENSFIVLYPEQFKEGEYDRNISERKFI
ncbi:MAG: cation:proton antiporter [Paludibacteraceae bacterium]|nr:cation:proton antiporter [Paludibacteraceae bacterium]